MTEAENKPARLMSLDTLRGFDMWFITGGTTLILELCRIFGASKSYLAVQMAHVPWAGLAHHDTIFPLFLFLAGVSFPFSLASQQAKGRTSGQIHRKVLVRMVTLYLLNVVPGWLQFNPNFRATGVLAFIGISWGLAAFIYLHVRRNWLRLLIIVALLVGYWAVLTFLAAPGAPVGADTYSKEWNIVSWLDRTLMPNHIWVRGVYDPESLFGLAGGVATALLGMSAGTVLRCGTLTPARKALTVFLSGLAVLAVDLVFIYVLGDVIVKALWSPSFVLSAAVYSFLMLALFYWIVDVLGWRKWTFYFRVIGMNAITIYYAPKLIGFGQTRDFFFKGLAGWVPPEWKGVVLTVGLLAVYWTFLYILYRKKIFIKV